MKRKSFNMSVCALMIMTLLFVGCGGNDCEEINPNYDPTEAGSQKCLEVSEGDTPNGPGARGDSAAPLLECVMDSDCESSQVCAHLCASDGPFCANPGDPGTSCTSDADCLSPPDPYGGITYSVCARGVCTEGGYYSGQRVRIPASECTIAEGGIETSGFESSVSSSCHIQDLGNNLRIIFGTDVSGASISPFYDPSDYPGTWAIHFTSIALRKGAEAYHVLSPDTGDCYDPFTFGAEDQPDNCCFETTDGHYYADGTPFGLDGIAELIYIDSEGIPREASKGRIDVLTFQTERYDYCEECSGGCADEPKGSLSVSLRFEGVEAQDPGCTFGVEGDIARLPDGVFNFYGTTGTPNSSFCGPGSSDLRCDPAYAARVASGTNANTNNGASGGGASSDNTSAAASGGDGAN